MKPASLDAANRWLNDPRILPFHASKALDLAPLWSDVVAFEFETGVVGFHNKGDGVWYGHLMLIPGAGDAYTHGRKALAEIFTRDDCNTVVARVPESNLRARRYAAGLGFRHDRFENGFEYRTLTREQFKDEVTGGMD